MGSYIQYIIIEIIEMRCHVEEGMLSVCFSLFLDKFTLNGVMYTVHMHRNEVFCSRWVGGNIFYLTLTSIVCVKKGGFLLF